MPNVISAEKRSVTYLENRKVFEWMEELARARKTDLAVILREATAAYCAQDRRPPLEGDLCKQRAVAKAAARRKMAGQIAAGVVTPKEAQDRNAPIRQPVQIVNLWPAIRRHTRA